MRDEDLTRWIEEDLGPRGMPLGDVTTLALVPPSLRLTAHLVARSAGVAAGLAEAERVFLEAGVKVEPRSADGARVEAGAVLLVAEGPASGVLAAERLALNVVGRMMGIATLTRRLQDEASAVNPACRVLATRKTTPGFRAEEKRAVALGGGDPHRFGLYDAFLVKDNHRMVVPDVGEAVRRCRALDPEKLVEVEVESLGDAHRAAAAGADVLLLDNLEPGEFAAWARDLRARHPGVLLEASGGITPDNLVAYAEHADRVSLGWLTHSVRALDVGLDVVAVEGAEGLDVPSTSATKPTNKPRP